MTSGESVVEPGGCPDPECLYRAADLDDQLAHVSVYHPGEWVETPRLGEPRGTHWVRGPAGLRP